MAHDYKATMLWRRGEQPFTDRKYSRAHEWIFDGLTVAASPAPEMMKPPLSRADAVDPEEGLVASLASCHMLFFLELAAKDGFRIDEYRDAAVGVMGKNERGRTMMAKITLNPTIVFSGEKRPTPADIARLHHASHDLCYIGNSLRTEVEIAQIEPVFA